MLSKEGLKPDPKNPGYYKHGITNKQGTSPEIFGDVYLPRYKFIPNLSQVAAPLRTLLEQNIEW